MLRACLAFSTSFREKKEKMMLVMGKVKDKNSYA